LQSQLAVLDPDEHAREERQTHAQMIAMRYHTQPDALELRLKSRESRIHIDLGLQGERDSPPTTRFSSARQKKQGTAFSAAPCLILFASLDPTPSLAWSGIRVLRR
jgi:hypothetical protein